MVFDPQGFAGRVASWRRMAAVDNDCRARAGSPQERKGRGRRAIGICRRFGYRLAEQETGAA